MLSTTVVNIISYFYPIGNTPAVSFVQDVPPGEHADILLLGCGDARNVLFTTFCNTGPLPRQLDITCCDIEPAILARNILLFTLLIDDSKCNSGSLHWQIYYHMFLDKKSSELLESQAQILLLKATTTQSWDASSYGKIIRFCDEGTLAMIRGVWKSYCISGLQKDDRSAFNAKFVKSVKSSLEQRDQRVGSGKVRTGFRSAAPTSFQALEDINQLASHFWKYGSTDKTPPILPQEKIPNPMFASSSTESLTIHYGIDPHLGFPLATGYAPLDPEVPSNSTQHKATMAARSHFDAWSKHFRSQASKNLVLRFCAGDAIAFCHSLQNRKVVDSGASNWYRTRYRMEPLVLDGTGLGPSVFDIIDTSNLTDHVGTLNIMVAASPLLKKHTISTLYTESLVAQEKDREMLRARILCGHFPTMSTLFGLVPTEYWTNATAISSVDENIMDILSDKTPLDEMKPKGQMFCRMSWKRAIPELNGIPSGKVHYKPSDLAAILHEVYRNMFHHQNMENLLLNITISKVLKMSSPVSYNRGSLVALLKLVMSQVDVQWSEFVEDLVSRIENDRAITIGSNHIQELYIQLHLQGVYTMPELSQHTPPWKFLDGIGAWTTRPPATCITLMVPRDNLQVFTDLSTQKLGTPVLQATVQFKQGFMAGAFNIFAELQLGFGTIKTFGQPTNEDFRLVVEDDPKGWLGSSALFVSFYGPTSFVMLDPQHCLVSLAVQASPMNLHTFMETLGPELNVFQANLKDRKHVFITKFPPSQVGYRLVGSNAPSPPAAGGANVATRTSISAALDSMKPQTSTLTGRLDLISGPDKNSLRNGASVELAQVSPFLIQVTIGRNDKHHDLVFPAPVVQLKSKTRIARKSSYIEVIVPLADHVTGDGFPNFMYPTIMSPSGPVVWNMPYLPINSLPVLNISKTEEMEWLILHTSLQMSGRERVLQGGRGAPQEPINADLRVNYKESLFSMFMQFTGLQGIQGRFFSLDKPSEGGGHVIILVSSLRLDLANHTVILDCAVIPLTEKTMPGLAPFLGANRRVFRIFVDNKELKLWREILPSQVERCRQWKHKPSCEYRVNNKIPLSIEDGEKVFCSCGMGQFPDNFIVDIPKWDVAKKFATRAAISPCFTVAYVEQVSYGVRDPVGPSKDGCWVCQKEKTLDGKALLRCNKCKVAKYCSKDCQVLDWKEHKKTCKPQVS